MLSPNPDKPEKKKLYHDGDNGTQRKTLNTLTSCYVVAAWPEFWRGLGGQRTRNSGSTGIAVMKTSLYAEKTENTEKSVFLKPFP
jgi:hypothetical protein